MVAIPQKATTIILLRDEGLREFEVYLLKRHEKSNFMGGNYVYPGGRIDPSDRNLEICRYTRGVSPEEAQKVLGEGHSPDEGLACWIAGIRELYEEAGVLLAYDRRGNPFLTKEKEEKERFAGYRDLLQRGSITLCQLAEKEQLLIGLDQLHYYSHWITPEPRPLRFDTYFFIARHPEGQEASHDQKETIAGIWATPREALEENLTGEIVLSPPTLKTLEDLSRHGTIAEVFESAKEHKIEPILPVLTKTSGRPLLVFPWDPEYERFQHGEVHDPMDHGRPSCQGDDTTRLIQKDGRWHPFCRAAAFDKRKSTSL